MQKNKFFYDIFEIVVKKQRTTKKGPGNFPGPFVV